MKLSFLYSFVVLSSRILVGVAGGAGKLVMTTTGPAHIGDMVTFTCDYTPVSSEGIGSGYWSRYDHISSSELGVTPGQNNDCIIQHGAEFLVPGKMVTWCNGRTNKLRLYILNIGAEDFKAGNNKYCCSVLTSTGKPTSYECGFIVEASPAQGTTTVRSDSVVSDDVTAPKASFLVCALMFFLCWLL